VPETVGVILPAMSTPPLSGPDLRAAAEAHRELGPEYGDAVVDSFLEKIEARLDARVDARLADLNRPRRGSLAGLSNDRRRSLLTGIMLGSGGLGVPIFLHLYSVTYYGLGTARDIWAALLVASAGMCGAGLARVFRDRRSE
jgi:hypothetical protein